MKPVIIIAIAVVCSVVAMIGVLAVFDEIDSIEEYQEKVKLQEKLQECISILMTFQVSGILHHSVLEKNEKMFNLHDQCMVEYDMKLDETKWKRVP